MKQGVTPTECTSPRFLISPQGFDVFLTREKMTCQDYNGRHGGDLHSDLRKYFDAIDHELFQTEYSHP